MSQSSHHLAIIGAGPYGLAAAAHLRAAGVETRVFGEAMSFWEQQMPKGMFLRSSWDASHIADPRGSLSLDAYEIARGEAIARRVPLDTFVAYGRWFQRQVAPDLDTRAVTWLERVDDGFELTLADGERLRAGRVIVATGLAGAANRPAVFEGIGPEYVSHASDSNDLGRFAGRRVAVVGGGQSAVESAAILNEQGAEVEVLIRDATLRWLKRSARLHKVPGLLGRALYPKTDVGPPGLSWIVALPDLLRRLPHDLQDKIAYRSIRPAASAWLYPRMAGVTLTTGHEVRAARPESGGLRLTLNDGSERVVDHVLLATGYKVDVARSAFLAPSVVQGVRRVGGYPVLRAGFESSVPGLHFVGAPAAYSFGPVMRFVSGTPFTGRALARRIGGESFVRTPVLAAAAR